MNKEQIKIFYFKRFTSLRVKILRVIETIREAKNPVTQSYLRDYLHELETIKETEQKSLNLFETERI